MNTQDSSNQKPQQPNFDKTFVEGSTGQTQFNNLNAGSRIDATNISQTNPYGVKRPAPTANDLPSGNEPLPLGSGTIVGLLGAGGMARVYKIWNEKLEVFRAVKILIPTQQGDLRNRFETEAKITAKLRHPNIVEIYSVGDFRGLPYLEMELIDGSALDQIIHNTGVLPPAVCSSIAIFVVRALTYAHNQEFLLYGKTYQGIIHRDLKPANIMISKHGDLRLMDFGIARPTEASLHTVEGNIVGTMQYLSPEQMDGVDVDARADIYSFGAILYEMITGTKTFPQDTITNLMKRKIMNEYRKFDDFDFNVPQGLAKISQKCLQLDKNDRYANAQLLLDDLENAHRSLSSQSPEAVLKAYLDDPSSISSHVGGKKPAWLSLKITIPAAAVVVVLALVAIFMLTGPKPEPQVQQQSPAVKEPVTQPVIPAQPQQPEAMQPLAPASPTQTTQQIKPAEPNEPDPFTQQTTQKSHDPRIKQSRFASVAPKSGKTEKNASASQKETAAEKNLAPIDRLKKEYNSSDFLDIAQAAIAKNAHDDALLALDNAPQNDRAFLLLIEALVSADKLRAAKEKVQSAQINDAQYNLLAGELYQKMGRNKDALENFQTALTKPSRYRNIREVRNDALYYTAVAYSEIYKDDPTPDNRGLALQSWRVVKNMYSNAPDNNRYKKAVSELSSIN